MKTSRRPLSAVCLICVLILASVASSFAQEKVDLDMINKIRYEGFHNSKIMQIATGLFEEIGARLTGSPNMKRANDWTRDQLSAFGLSNARLEPWSPFGRGWSNEYTNIRMTSPDVATFIAYPKAWTPGTGDAPVHAQVVRVTVRLTNGDFQQDLAKYKGKLAGKIVLYGDDVDQAMSTEPLAKRHDEKSLEEIEHYQIPGGPVNPAFRDFATRARLGRELSKFFDDEKPLAVIDRSRGAIGGGTVFVQQGGSYKVRQTVAPPWVTLAAEHWDRISHILADKKDVELEVNVKNTFSDADTQWDPIAEIPGTDKKDEVVMVGAHLDSWHAGTGATDNGAGTIVMMEAMR